MPMLEVVRLEDWFCEQLQEVSVSDPARAYLTTLFSSMKTTKDDMSRESVVLAYARARDRREFSEFQRIGDWTIWSLSMVPEHVKEHDLAVDLGRLSYYACWRMLRGEWTLYEELADDLPRISRKVSKALHDRGIRTRCV